VRKSDLVSPISSSNRDDSELSKNDGSSNSSCNFLSALNSKTNVSIVISNNNKCLESGSLSCSSLLLNGHDLHNFILELSLKEEIDDLMFFDGQCKEVNFFEFGDEFFLH